MLGVLWIEMGLDGEDERAKGIGKATMEERNEVNVAETVSVGVSIAETVEISELGKWLISQRINEFVKRSGLRCKGRL